MSYNSFIYLAFFLGIVWLLWALLPQRLRPAALLGGSVFFYWFTAKRFVLFILLVALLTWAVALLLGKLDELFAATRAPLPPSERKALKKRVSALKKGVVAGGVVGLLGVFIWVKYLPFLAGTLNDLLTRLPGGITVTVPAYIAPLGLSFFSLMAVSYVVDVYRGAVKAAPRYWQVLLYLSFWPHVVQGPFDRYGALAPTLFDPPRPSYRAVAFGAQRILWGMFKKVVIADRANMYVKAVFDDWTQYSGAAVLVGTLLYTLQLYAEFSGCMDIVVGSAELFGVPLAENFRQPFFSKTVGEFWRRWHITLGAWLREYLFQPAILSKPMMRFGKFCREKISPAAGRKLPVWIGLLLTWVAIGWWHGAAWIYLLYGLYYFVLLFLSDACEPLFCKLIPALPRLRTKGWYKLWQMGRTFVLVSLGMLLFRANGGAAAAQMLKSLAAPYNASLLIKLDARDMAVLVLGAVLMLAVDILHERGVHLRHNIAARPLPLRWAVYIGGVLLVLIFGAYGDNYDPAAFIYAQF